VLATGTTLMNARTITNENVNPKYSFEKCDNYATVVGDMYELSYEEEHNEFLACMDMQE
jgi:hypothetical protein